MGRLPVGSLGGSKVKVGGESVGQTGEGDTGGDEKGLWNGTGSVNLWGTMGGCLCHLE